MNYNCPECKTAFDEKTAYCENWQVKEKSFACPNCKTFYFRKVTKRTNLTILLVIQLTLLAVFLLLMFEVEFLRKYNLVFIFIISITAAVIGKVTDGAPKKYLEPVNDATNRPQFQ